MAAAVRSSSVGSGMYSITTEACRKASKAARRLPRWLVWIMVPGIVGPMLIFGWILITESAHKSEDCPYATVSEQSVAGARVLEEGRSCIEGVEERRYTLLRGERMRRLGRRRFASEAFAPDKYRWTAAVTGDGEVQVTVENDGHDNALFREGTTEEHEKGISKSVVR